jgi:hypothetical protein
MISAGESAQLTGDIAESPQGYFTFGANGDLLTFSGRRNIVRALPSNAETHHIVWS